MNNFIKITFILSLIASCDMETVIDLEIPQDPPMIVLNGVLDTDTTISVVISNSVGAFSNNNPAFLPNAEAFLYENNSLIGQIFPDTDTAYQVNVYGDGLQITYPMYVYKINHTPTKNFTYRIEVNHPAFTETAIAETRIPNDLNIFNIDVDTTLDGGDITRLNFSFNDDGNKRNYYMIKVYAECEKEVDDEYGYYWDYEYLAEDIPFYSNDPSFPQQFNIFDEPSGYSFEGDEVIFSDALFDGQEKNIILDIPTYEYKFSYCDTVNIEFSTFSEDTYSYYSTLNNHLDNGEVNIFGGEVVSVYTNVQNGLGALISRNTQIISLK
ncbi:DUF4249 domain-containing protein [Bacteroidota bacterium]|nr:DUF4249 domain-containing protein [Bacteroidota bacterium]